MQAPRILVMVALLALAALAQNDGAATSTATAGADDDDDDAQALPSTGGPALIAPLAGALLIGSGVVAGLIGLRRNP